MNASPGILIIRLSSLGDILHTLPALAGLRAAYPNARIDWLVAKKCEFLMSAVKGIHRVHVLDTSALLRFPPDKSAWRALRNLIRNLRAIRYDFIIDFQGLLKTAFLSALCRSNIRLGFSKNLVRERPAHWFYQKTLGKPQQQVHVLVLNRMLAQLAGALPASLWCDLQVSENDQSYVDSILNEKQLHNFVVINPGGGWPTKRWKPERYGALAKKIIELGLPVIVTTAPEEEILYRLIEETGRDAALFHFPISFLQLIPLLKKTRLFIGGDTGPFHLACALGTPVVGILGPTLPVRNGPWQARDEAVFHPLPCSACHARICSTGNECMNISVEEVYAAVVRRLKNMEDSLSARS
jgi:lipopolysaccharide heptosyltransferase I